MEAETSQPSLFDEISRCRAWIEGSLTVAHGTYAFDDVVQAIYNGKFQFWPLENAVVLTEIQQYPRKRALHVFLAGGSLREIKGFEPKLEDFGRLNGCVSLTCAGRRGWHRIADRDGLKPASYFTERAL